MEVIDLIRDFERRDVKNLCSKLDRYWSLGLGLRPAMIFPRGGAVDPQNCFFDCSAEAWQEWDRSHSKWLLEWSDRMEQQFPEIAAEYAGLLSAGKRTWERLAAA